MLGCMLDGWFQGPSQIQRWTAAGCTHEAFTVEQGKTYRFRLISNTDLMYTTVCFEGHNVTVFAADGFPIDPFVSPCIDVNSAQRYAHSVLCGCAALSGRRDTITSWGFPIRIASVDE